MRATVMTALLTVGIVATASAQPAARLADVAQRVDTGDRVDVIGTSGEAFPGRLVRVTADEIVVEDRSGNARTFTASSIQRIDRRGDSLRNGMRRGAIVGGVIGAALGAGFSGEFRATDLLSGAALFGGTGLLVGLYADAVHVGATPVYVAPPTGGQGARRGAGGLAVLAALRW